MRLLALLALPLAVLLAGCQTGEVKAVVPIAGGGQITVPVSGRGPAPGEGEGYRVQAAVLQPGQSAREVYYQFSLTSTRTSAPRRVQVEDISDEKAYPLVDDARPKFESGAWTGKSEALAAEDARLRWVMQITSSLRVYRFTLTTDDGRTISFNHVSSYPPFIKAAIRAKWGENY